MYNLIVTAEAGAWERSRYSMPLSRLGEYSPESFKARYRPLDERAISELTSFPTLFAYEDPKDLPALVGRVTRITRSSGSDLRFDFEIEPDVPPISPAQLAEIGWDLDVGDVEMNRTHWAVKDIELFDVLRDAGLLEKDALTSLAHNFPASPRHDVFICHASEDKDVARPLAEALRDAGLSVWYDEYTLQVGDSLRRSIDGGLAGCRYGVVILSPNFFKKEWAQKELDGLAAREVDGVKVILPVWHALTREEVARRSPMLADRVAANTGSSLEQVVVDLLNVVQE